MIKKKEFATTAFDPKHEAFIVYVVAFIVDSGNKGHLSRCALIAHFKADKVSTKVPSKYADFVDVFRFTKIDCRAFYAHGN